MSLKSKAYIGFIIALGFAAAVRGVVFWHPHDLIRFACYLLLAIPASCLKVRLPGVTGTMSVLFVILLAAVVELGLAETIIIGATCALFQSFWHAKVRPRPVQIVFSVAVITLAVSASDLAQRSPWMDLLYLQAPFRLALAASVFFLVNTAPVAAVIALTEGKSFRQVWTDCYSWSFPYYLVGAAIVGMFGFANRLLDWQAWLLILPVVYVIYRSYVLYLGRLEHQRQQAQEQRAHAEEVAALLAQSMAANAKLDAVIQASPLAILALDGEGKVMSWNNRAERIFGWTADDVLGRYLPSGSPRAGDKTVQSIVDRTLQGEPLSGMELAQWRKDGTSFDAAVWTAPLRDGAESAAGILLTVADVSDRKRLEETLRLSQKMEAIGRLAGGIAHDFNNLLTIINGYGSMLIGELEANPYAQSQAEEILNAGNRAADLVAQLMAFSRRQVIKPTPLKMNDLVGDLERMLSRLIGEHIDFRTVLDEDAGIIMADQSQMTTILMNLVTNARDAMPNGGVLSIETSRVRITEETRYIQPDLEVGEYVQLTVKDTGSGMDAATQERLFEPFFTTKANGKGTGLGLSSVYGGVQQHRGRITVSTQLGKGTTFSIYLPCQEPAEPVGPGVETTLKSVRGTETILLVEDETPLRRMLREALAKAGYRVWQAGNGVEAIEQWNAAGGKIDLLISDVIMPVMNGLRLAQNLTAKDPNLKVIFMSGHAEDVITKQGVIHAGLDLVPKPFLPEVLVQKVRHVLDQAPKSVTR